MSLAICEQSQLDRAREPRYMNNYNTTCTNSFRPRPTHVLVDEDDADVIPGGQRLERRLHH
jgi:hypothetical protein